MPAVDLIPLIGALLVFVVCYALLTAYKSTLGAVLALIADKINVGILGRHPFGFLASALHDLDSYIRAGLAGAMQGAAWAWTKVLHAHAVLWHDLTSGVADLAEATEQELRHIVRHTLPAFVIAYFNPWIQIVQALRRSVAFLVAESAKAVHSITKIVTHETTKVVTHIERFVVVKTRTVVHAIPGLHAPAIPRLGRLEREVHGIDETLKDTAKKVTPAALAAVFAASVLSKLGLTWLRCRNVNQLGRRVCSLDPRILDGLLLGLVAIFGTLDLRKFGKQVQAVTATFEGEVRHFWRADLGGVTRNPGLGDTGL